MVLPDDNNNQSLGKISSMSLQNRNKQLHSAETNGSLSFLEHEEIGHGSAWDQKIQISLSIIQEEKAQIQMGYTTRKEIQYFSEKLGLNLNCSSAPQPKLAPMDTNKPHIIRQFKKQIVVELIQLKIELQDLKRIKDQILVFVKQYGTAFAKIIAAYGFTPKSNNSSKRIMTESTQRSDIQDSTLMSDQCYLKSGSSTEKDCIGSPVRRMTLSTNHPQKQLCDQSELAKCQQKIKVLEYQLRKIRSQAQQNEQRQKRLDQREAEISKLSRQMRMKEKDIEKMKEQFKTSSEKLTTSIKLIKSKELRLDVQLSSIDLQKRKIEKYENLLNQRLEIVNRKEKNLDEKKKNQKSVDKKYQIDRQQRQTSPQIKFSSSNSNLIKMKQKFSEGLESSVKNASSTLNLRKSDGNNAENARLNDEPNEVYLSSGPAFHRRKSTSQKMNEFIQEGKAKMKRLTDSGKLMSNPCQASRN